MSRFSALAGATVTGAVLGSAVLLGAAHADTLTVTFEGAGLLGLPVLSCASQPTQASISMSAGDTLEVKNLTGSAAVIYVNGSKATSNANIGSNSMAPITFPAGTWQVALKPACLLNLNDAGSVTVTVSAAKPPPAKPAVAPPAATDLKTVDIPPTVAPAEPTQTTAPKPTQTKAAKPAPAGTPTPTPTRHATSTTSALAPTAAATTAGATTGTTTIGATTSGATPTASIDPDSVIIAPTTTATDDPSTTGDVNASGAAKAADTGSATGGDSTSGGADAGMKTTAKGVAVGPSVSLGEDSSSTPNYLLVLLTSIGIVGVGAAAIKALILQRATRRAY